MNPWIFWSLMIMFIIGALNILVHIAGYKTEKNRLFWTLFYLVWTFIAIKALGWL